MFPHTPWKYDSASCSCVCVCEAVGGGGQPRSDMRGGRHVCRILGDIALRHHKRSGVEALPVGAVMHCAARPGCFFGQSCWPRAQRGHIHTRAGLVVCAGMLCCCYVERPEHSNMAGRTGSAVAVSKDKHRLVARSVRYSCTPLESHHPPGRSSRTCGMPRLASRRPLSMTGRETCVASVCVGPIWAATILALAIAWPL